MSKRPFPFSGRVGPQQNPTQQPPQIKIIITIANNQATVTVNPPIDDLTYISTLLTLANAKANELQQKATSILNHQQIHQYEPTPLKSVGGGEYKSNSDIPCLHCGGLPHYSIHKIEEGGDNGGQAS